MNTGIDAAQIFSQATSQAPKAHKGQNKEGIRAAAQEFEAIFIKQMYKEMRNTITDGGLIEKGNADAIYNDMQDMEAAKMTAERGGIGLADMMMQQLME